MVLMWRAQVAVRGGIPASASVTSFAAVYGASASGDDVGQLDGLWAPDEAGGGPRARMHLSPCLMRSFPCAAAAHAWLLLGVRAMKGTPAS